VQLLADSGQSEGDRHDFKLNLPDAKNLTKVACAFANTYGGFFIIGVSERNGHHFTIEGIDPDKELTLIKSFLANLPTRSGALPPLQSSGQFQFEFRKPRSSFMS
jgi:predicted HTH transcriptional regulator